MLGFRIDTSSDLEARERGVRRAHYLLVVGVFAVALGMVGVGMAFTTLASDPHAADGCRAGCFTKPYGYYSLWGLCGLVFGALALILGYVLGRTPPVGLEISEEGIAWVYQDGEKDVLGWDRIAEEDASPLSIVDNTSVSAVVAKRIGLRVDPLRPYAVCREGGASVEISPQDLDRVIEAAHAMGLEERVEMIGGGAGGGRGLVRPMITFGPIANPQEEKGSQA